MFPRFPRNAILLGLLALAAAPQTFAEGANPEDQSFELGQITITGAPAAAMPASTPLPPKTSAAATAKISPKHSSPCPA